MQAARASTVVIRRRVCCRVRSPGGETLAILSVPLALQASSLALQTLQRSGVGDLLTGRQHRQVPDAHIHPDRAHLAVGGGKLAGELAGEDHIPATGCGGDGGREDAAGAALEMAGELAGRLMGLEDADPWELDVLAVAQHPDRPSGEPAGIPAASALEAREADRAALAAAVPGVAPVLQRTRQAVQPGRVGFLAVVRPPWGGLVLGAVPLAP
jgi:hypothetical protein